MTHRCCLSTWDLFSSTSASHSAANKPAARVLSECVSSALVRLPARSCVLVNESKNRLGRKICLICDRGNIYVTGRDGVMASGH